MAPGYVKKGVDISKNLSRTKRYWKVMITNPSNGKVEDRSLGTALPV